MMVKITGYREVVKKDGSGSFVLLELNAGVEFVQSNNSGHFYAKMRRCFIPSTLNADSAESIIGQQIPGEIVRVQCEPYEYIAHTGEPLLLQHRYMYQPEGSMELIGKEPVNEPLTA